MAEPYEYSFPASNALYNASKDLIFTRRGLTYRVGALFEDRNDRNLKIDNEERLKSELYSLIKNQFNARVNKEEYGLDKGSYYDRLPKDGASLLKIKKPKIISSGPGGVEDLSGYYKTYPIQFVCKLCGDLQQPSKKELRTFDIHRCKVKGCDGAYEQVSVLRYCETCGNVDIFYYNCQNNKSHSVKLKRPQKDALITWEFKCAECDAAPRDIFTWNCYHEHYGETVSNQDPTKYRPLTIRETGVFTPVVKSTIDLPKTEALSEEAGDDVDYYLLGLYLDSFRGIGEHEISTINDLEEYYAAATNQVTAKSVLGDEAKGKTKEEILKLCSQKIGIPRIREKVEGLKSEYADVDISQFKDYVTLLGRFTEGEIKEPVSYEQYVHREGENNSDSFNRYQQLTSDLGIDKITYLPRVKILSTYIGYIKGPNKFYEEGFVPHFEPIWASKKEREELEAYTYPFETEGIMVELDKLEVGEWLNENGLISEKPGNAREASQILMEMPEGSSEYNALKDLLHSFSHLLIRLSSLHTGIESQSCSELVFTNPASIFIYSTNTVNIGGFQFLFENALYEWLKNLQLETRDCTFDPICKHEKGACFSCMYLAEYVCNYFNKDLDRDTFFAETDRYQTPYWEP